MSATPAGQDIPWHRVINSKGEISGRKDGGSDHGQRQRLVDEGIVFDKNNRISFELFGWAEAEIPLIPEDWPEDWPSDVWEENTSEPGPTAKMDD